MVSGIFISAINPLQESELATMIQVTTRKHTSTRHLPHLICDSSGALSRYRRVNDRPGRLYISLRRSIGYPPRFFPHRWCPGMTTSIPIPSHRKDKSQGPGMLRSVGLTHKQNTAQKRESWGRGVSDASRSTTS